MENGMIQEKKSKKMVLIDTDNAWTELIDEEISLKYIEEGAARSGKGNTIKLLLNENDLFFYVRERDESICRICNASGSFLHYISPLSSEGIASPVNAVFICAICLEKINNIHPDVFTVLRIENIESLISHGTPKKKCLQCGESRCFSDFKKTNILHIPREDICRSCVSLNKKLIPPPNKECIFCHDEKPIYEFFSFHGKLKPYCKSCDRSNFQEGIVFVLNEKNEVVDYVSIEKADMLALKHHAVFRGKRFICKKKRNRFVSFVHTLLQDKMISREPILVSKSGKWSCEVSKSLAEIMLREEIIIQKSPFLFKMTLNIDELKTKIIERDKRKCVFCGKNGYGVFYTDKLITLSNSCCVCFQCQYEREKDSFAKWLNVPIIEFPFFHFGYVLLLEKNGDKRIYLNREIANKLYHNGMIEFETKKRARVKFGVEEFRQFVLDRDQRKCHYCGEKGTTVDHVISKLKGGMTTPTNCVCACDECNRQKRSMSKTKFLKLIGKG